MTTGDATKPPTNAVAMATGDMTKPNEVLTNCFTKPVVPHASEIAEMELGIGSTQPLSAPLFTTCERRETLSKPLTPLPTSPLQHAPNLVSSRDVPALMPLSSRNVCSRSAFTTDWISFIPEISKPPCRHVSEEGRKSKPSEQGNMKSGPSPSVRVVKIEKIDPIEVYREPAVKVVKRKDSVKIEKKDAVVRVPGNAARDVGKRKSAVVASQKLAEPEYKELAEYEKEELAASTSRKRKLARPPSPGPDPEPVVQKQRQGPVQTSTSLKLLIRQTKNRTYIR
eukprot:sb/3467861/